MRYVEHLHSLVFTCYGGQLPTVGTSRGNASAEGLRIVPYRGRGDEAGMLDKVQGWGLTEDALHQLNLP